MGFEDERLKRFYERNTEVIEGEENDLEDSVLEDSQDDIYEVRNNQDVYLYLLISGHEIIAKRFKYKGKTYLHYPLVIMLHERNIRFMPLISNLCKDLDESMSQFLLNKTHYIYRGLVQDPIADLYNRNVEEFKKVLPSMTVTASSKVVVPEFDKSKLNL